MEVKTVGVYGAGMMGRGIAQVALEGGYLRELALRREPFGIGVERAEVLPDGEILVGDKGFDLLEELPNGLAVF